MTQSDTRRYRDGLVSALLKRHSRPQAVQIIRRALEQACWRAQCKTQELLKTALTVYSPSDQYRRRTLGRKRGVSRREESDSRAYSLAAKRTLEAAETIPLEPLEKRLSILLAGWYLAAAGNPPPQPPPKTAGAMSKRRPQ